MKDPQFAQDVAHTVRHLTAVFQFPPRGPWDPVAHAHWVVALVASLYAGAHGAPPALSEALGVVRDLALAHADGPLHGRPDPWREDDPGIYSATVMLESGRRILARYGAKDPGLVEWLNYSLSLLKQSHAEVA